MTKTKAIQFLQDFIEYKQFQIQIFQEENFETDVEPIRAGLVSLAKKDIKKIKKIMAELMPKNDSKRRKKSL